MALDERYLLEGAWYATEQCGLLLRDAVLLHEGGRYGSAVGLAMFAREELGRARILLRLAADVRGGRFLTLEELENEVEDHVEKQTAAQLSVVYRGAPGSVLSELVTRAHTNTPTAESEAAREEFDRLLKRISRRTPSERHLARQRALFVDPSAAGTAWNRPAAFAKDEASRMVCDACNDYSVFRGSLLEGDRHARVRTELAPWAERPDLPGPIWPDM
jgi:AbiV family abortive infection protein